MNPETAGFTSCKPAISVVAGCQGECILMYADSDRSMKLTHLSRWMWCSLPESQAGTEDTAL